MTIFVTGASGFIGGSVAQALHDAGHQVSGLVRSEEKATALAKRGIEPVFGTLDDIAVLQKIDDLITLYLLALEKAPAASFFFAENGEASLKEVAGSVSKALGFNGKTESWNAEDALRQEGDWARFALGSNSRVRGINARRLLGWLPVGPSLNEALERRA